MAIGIGLGAWQGAPHLAPRLGLCAEGAAPVRAAFSFPLGSSGHDGDASEPPCLMSSCVSGGAMTSPILSSRNSANCFWPILTP